MSEHRVSDHAILRYLERAKGIDVEAVRAHILALCKPAMAAGATALRSEGVQFQFSRTGAVVTVLPLSKMANKTKHRLQGGG